MQWIRPRTPRTYTRAAHLAQLIASIGHPPKERSNITLADSVANLEGEDKRLFLEFVSRVLQWLPEKRSTPAELLFRPLAS
ncbi:hypothetical protein K503DRAFT_688931 [Rhizopogon vinicolor AM-OR11-026]|uniref:Uncharacterized protein n=1 Tax=Rhizopogon vinicolor AM-OR11-026 TaxID=1314800 RepID=A0A1B7N4J3_9AGAM|nr:hypothetical protein K503DRAFT_688931 [Rhizopogon vinicolor AM-OR11-026]